MTSDRPLRWGILGTARIAEKIVQAIARSPRGEVVAIASRDADRARQFADQHQIARSYGSYQALLDDAEIDAVYIPLPPSLHAEWTIRALEAGRHVLCEKPLARTVAEAERMVDASRRCQKLLMDGVMWRHHPRCGDMQAALQAGVTGPLRRITSAMSFPAQRLRPDDLRRSAELGGGALLDVGWYCVNASLWAAGDMPVQVWGTQQIRDGVDWTFTGVLWFPHQVMASFDCGFGMTARKWIEVAGESGSIVCDDFARPWNHEKARFWIHDDQGKVADKVSVVVIQEDAMIEAFQQRVREGNVACDWAQESLRVQRVCAALQEAALTGQPVAVSA